MPVSISPYFRAAAALPLLLAALIPVGCGQEEGPHPEAHEDHAAWLKGDTETKFTAVEEQLGGFGTTMWEMGYRYIELYWAGQDENPEYAEHQLHEMEEALERGLIRRPERAASARTFLENSIPAMRTAIASRDTVRFRKAFTAFTQSCNACHALEDHAYITVAPPTFRLSPVQRVR